MERAIEQGKTHHILQGVIPTSLHAQLEMKFGLFVAYILVCVKKIIFCSSYVGDHDYICKLGTIAVE